MYPVLIVGISFACATLWLLFLVTNAPSLPDDATLAFPSSLEELKQTAALLSDLFKQESQRSYVVTLYVSAYLFKQTFAMPGSLFLNTLAGAVFGLKTGLLLVCFLNSFGAALCYFLARLVGEEYACQYFPDKVDFFKKKLEENKQRLPYFLLFLRLFPPTPNWAVNLCCGLFGVPFYMFFSTVLFGMIPYNYASVQAGVLISELAHTTEILSWSTLPQWTLVAVIALLPGFLLKKEQAVNE